MRLDRNPFVLPNQRHSPQHQVSFKCVPPCCDVALGRAGQGLDASRSSELY